MKYISQKNKDLQLTCYISTDLEVPSKVASPLSQPGSLPAKWPIHLPTSSLKMSILFRMVFSICLLGTQNRSPFCSVILMWKRCFTSCSRRILKFELFRALQGQLQHSCGSPSNSSVATPALELVLTPPTLPAGLGVDVGPSWSLDFGGFSLIRFASCTLNFLQL